jgi:PKD repeat protein
MKKTYFTLLALFFGLAVQAQMTPNQPTTPANGAQHAQWAVNQNKAPGDSCGAYYNNHIGFVKNAGFVYYQSMRQGNVTESTHNSGFAQKFTCPQPIEVSGVQFYSFELNPLLDSIMAITILHDYTTVNDSVGTELARDTVWVKHQAFSTLTSDMLVNSLFDTPVTVTSDYIVTVMTPTDDSLKILTTDYIGDDGNMDGDAYIFFENLAYPSFTGYYNMFAYGAGFDYDFYIAPRIKYDLHDQFLLSDDTICPGVINATCVDYTQFPIYSDEQYNGFYTTPTDHILWLWGDGFQNTDLLTACHTYNNAGDYTIQLNDTLFRHDFSSAFCIGSSTQAIHVIDDPVPNFTFSMGGSIIDFTSTSSNYDSLFWDMGDMTTYSDSVTLSHDFDSLGTFDVWLFAYNECGMDSIMIQVTTNDVGFDTYDFDFNIYPNPSNDNVTVDGVIEGSRIELMNILGEVVYSTTANGTKEKLNVYELSSGTYFVKVSTDLGQVTKKLVVRH